MKNIKSFILGIFVGAALIIVIMAMALFHPSHGADRLLNATMDYTQCQEIIR